MASSESAIARSLARKVWIDNPGKSDQYLRRELRLQAKQLGIDPVTIAILVRLAIQLWIWWRTHRIAEPKAADADLKELL